MSTKHPPCPVCAGRSIKHGTTTSSRQRWRCKECGHTFTRCHDDAGQAMWFRVFVDWLTSGISLNTLAKIHNVSVSTLQRRFATFWYVQPPMPADPHRVYDQVFIDGTYFNTKCLLVLADCDHVISWFWGYTEDSWAYGRLLDTIAPPLIATTDGHKGSAKAIRNTWPETKIQRCLVHVKRNIQTATGLHPTSAMGKALRRLSLELLHIDDLDQAADWTIKLQKFGQTFNTQLNEKSYVKDTPLEQIPKSKRHNKRWWYTHYTHRAAYMQLVRLSKAGHLFTYLTEKQGTIAYKSTTNSLEGGINSPIKSLLHAHRGLRDEHQRIACDWWLYTHTQHPRDPVDIAREQNWGKDATAKATILAHHERQTANGHDDGRPALLDNAIDADYNHSMGIRKGTIH
ncbi:IS1249 family transposase [Corynebacterium lizhenjunii]|uniref:IS1249 family transposase n=2 Tax=Corynebacterium lizhenjunii TaxID=2709394 RepID=A0A7T0KEM9_9CORY|nr:IS1249 family transposase [Corynebacterium lizhenjunii]QPK79207.1 IS1249 family transposase [Corynebacterium lizhenjunii]QPK79537.1 IS1249 family transposase [Corynebacterium lizhenjunii]